MHSEEGPVAISVISVRQNVTVRYLEQLLPKLKKAGIIKSVRGAQGGYLLSADPESISVGDVLRILEGDINLVACAGLVGHGEECSGSKYCVTKTVWKRINDSIQETVDAISLKELMDDFEEIQLHKKDNEIER